MRLKKQDNPCAVVVFLKYVSFAFLCQFLFYFISTSTFYRSQQFVSLLPPFNSLLNTTCKYVILLVLLCNFRYPLVIYKRIIKEYHAQRYSHLNSCHNFCFLSNIGTTLGRGKISSINSTWTYL